MPYLEDFTGVHIAGRCPTSYEKILPFWATHLPTAFTLPTVMFGFTLHPIIRQLTTNILTSLSETLPISCGSSQERGVLSYTLDEHGADIYARIGRETLGGLSHYIARTCFEACTYFLLHVCSVSGRKPALVPLKLPRTGRHKTWLLVLA